VISEFHLILFSPWPVSNASISPDLAAKLGYICLPGERRTPLTLDRYSTYSYRTGSPSAQLASRPVSNLPICETPRIVFGEVSGLLEEQKATAARLGRSTCQLPVDSGSEIPEVGTRCVPKLGHPKQKGVRPLKPTLWACRAGNLGSVEP
jgi:hypothetical protein